MPNNINGINLPYILNQKYELEFPDQLYKVKFSHNAAFIRLGLGLLPRAMAAVKNINQRIIDCTSIPIISI